MQPCFSWENASGLFYTLGNSTLNEIYYTVASCCRFGVISGHHCVVAEFKLLFRNTHLVRSYSMSFDKIRRGVLSESYSIKDLSMYHSHMLFFRSYASTLRNMLLDLRKFLSCISTQSLIRMCKIYIEKVPFKLHYVNAIGLTCCFKLT